MINPCPRKQNFVSEEEKPRFSCVMRTSRKNWLWNHKRLLFFFFFLCTLRSRQISHVSLKGVQTNEQLFFPLFYHNNKKTRVFFFFTDDLWMQTANQQKKNYTNNKLTKHKKKYYSNKMNTISTTEMYVEYNDTFKVNKPQGHTKVSLFQYYVSSFQGVSS